MSTSQPGDAGNGPPSEPPPTGPRPFNPGRLANLGNNEPPPTGMPLPSPSNIPKLDGGRGMSTSQPGDAGNGPPSEVPPVESRAGAGGAPEAPQTVTSTSYPATAANKPVTEIAPAVQFQQNKRIQGSERWIDSNYEVFRNYRSEWHDRDWWRSHQARIVFGVGGWYYWNAGYWYPAWGYDPNAYYAYDGPIYGYNDLPPDQVIADVQEALQQQGYYQGEVDGLLGPPTRAAIADYQRDRSLYITSAIDSPTLQSLQ